MVYKADDKSMETIEMNVQKTNHLKLQSRLYFRYQRTFPFNLIYLFNII